MAEAEKTKRVVTLADVAACAGVSKAAISSALTGRGGTTKVCPKTAERIRLAAEKLGYKPNFRAKALRTGRCGTIGVLIPSPNSFRYQFYQDMIAGLSDAMDADGNHMLMMFRRDDFKYMDVIEQGKVDGFVVIQSDPTDAHIEKVAASGAPAVIMNKTVDTEGRPNLGCVRSDNEKFVKDLTSDFLSDGCRKILAIYDDSVSDTNMQVDKFIRREGERLAASGVSIDSLVPDRHNLKPQFLELFRHWRNWDGVFIDHSAYGDVLTEAADECGVKAGKDFVLITTNVREGRFTRDCVERSFYYQDGLTMGREAWRLMSALVDKTGEGNRTVLVPYLKQLAEKRP